MTVMTEHYRQLRLVHVGRVKGRNVWSAGCPCGWRTLVRGNRKEASAAWRGHMQTIQRELVFEEPS